MRRVFMFIIFLSPVATLFGQLPKKAVNKMGKNPVMFLDSVETEMSVLQSLNPFDISNISVVNPKKAKKLLGDKANDGAVYVTTVKAARICYWNYFRTKSDDYKQLLITPQSDTIVQYILNGELLTDSAAPGSLFFITDKNFKSINIFAKENLLSDNVIPKRYVVAIRAKKPKGPAKRKTSK